MRNVRSEANRMLVADFDLEPFGLTPEELSLRSAVDEDSFVRISPRSGNSDQGQTIRQLLNGGITCVVDSIDWINGVIRLRPMYQN